MKTNEQWTGNNTKKNVHFLFAFDPLFPAAHSLEQRFIIPSMIYDKVLVVEKIPGKSLTHFSPWKKQSRGSLAIHSFSSFIRSFAYQLFLLCSTFYILSFTDYKTYSHSPQSYVNICTIIIFHFPYRRSAMKKKENVKEKVCIDKNSLHLIA